MTDDPLKQLFEDDSVRSDAATSAAFVPATDPAFRLEVMSRVAHRRFLFSLAQRGGIALLLALIFLTIWPVLAGLSTSLNHALLLGAVTLTLMGAVAFGANWVAGNVVARRR